MDISYRDIMISYDIYWVRRSSRKQQVDPASAVQSRVQSYLPPMFDDYIDHCGWASVTVNVVAANRNQDSSFVTSKHNSHRSDIGLKWHGFCVF